MMMIYDNDCQLMGASTALYHMGSATTDLGTGLDGVSTRST